MKTYDDVKVNYGAGYERVSLSKLCGLNIKDITGYIYDNGGGNTFHMSRIHLEDGTDFFCEGEHENAYIAVYGDGEKLLSEELLENIRITDPDYEPEEE